MTVNTSKLAAVWPSTDAYDVLIHAETKTFTVVNNLSTSFGVNLPLLDSKNNAINFQGLPVGIYSFGDGVWYDTNGNDGPILAEFWSMSDKTGYFQWIISASGIPGVAAGASVTMTVKCGLLSIADSETLAAPIGGGKLLSYNTGVNYEKIAVRGEIAAVAAIPGATVAHNLGYVPNYRVWKHESNGTISPRSFTALLGGGMRIDSTNLILDGSTLETGSWYYRVYKQAT